ncbi:MAG: signal recognition particle-docking protein FtsY, partial [Pseudomonadota bacterium]|nr:signal recognition particle-docking protein FtsY [Pseudomonadota bacterium]
GTSLSDSLFEEIEDHLLLVDMGVEASQSLVEALRETARREKFTDAAQLIDALREGLLEILQPCQQPLDFGAASKPYVIVMVGVNGVGKTTTLAKMASRLQSQGHGVMLAACDTFRAAAIEQLQVWGDRLQIPVIAQEHGSDAAAVAYDAFGAAAARGSEVLLIDSAGRQHTHGDLMEQLKKISRVLAKARQDLPHEVMLTVDAGNGQNVLSQVEHFQNAVNVSGLCITKLDGTAKGGVVVALAKRFGLPIRYIGVGEGVDDLREFDAGEFVEALLPESV